MTNELAWITARIQILEEAIVENGSRFELKEAQDVLVSADQAFRVKKKHGVSLADTVLVETKPCGAVVNHWRTAH